MARLLFAAFLSLLCLAAPLRAQSSSYLDRPAAKYLVYAILAKAHVDRCPKQLRIKPNLRTEYREAYAAFLELFKDENKRNSQIMNAKRLANSKNCAFHHEHFNMVKGDALTHRYIQSIN